MNDSPSEAVIQPVLSQSFIGYLRDAAKVEPWPKGVMFAAEADYHTANANADEAHRAGDMARLDEAIMARADAAGRKARIQERVTRLGMTLLSHAATFAGEELGDIIAALSVIQDLAARVADLETVIAEGVASE